MVSKIKFSKDILIVLPGKSHLNAVDKMNKLYESGCTLISVNFVPNDVNINYVFISNTKRVDQVGISKIPVIKTSNIDYDFENQEVVRYSEHINQLEYVNDNPLLMLLSLLKQYDFSQISIAGLDGYDPLYRSQNNLYNENSILDDSIVTKNENIARYLEDYKKTVKINFITPYVFINFK